MSEFFTAGIKNCVEDCGAVEHGQSVHVVSEEGAADKPVAKAIAALAWYNRARWWRRSQSG